MCLVVSLVQALYVTTRMSVTQDCASLRSPSAQTQLDGRRKCSLFFWNLFPSFFNKVKNDVFHTLKTLMDTDTGTDSDSVSCPIQK